MIRKNRLIGFGISLLVLITLSVLWQHRWNIYDAYKLRNYTPPARVVTLADDVSMSDYGRRLFYVYRPELNNKQDFNENCHGGERTIVLGCYVSGTGIYLYNVTEPRLEGVLQVTSAHEMLHAAYGRLSSADRKQVGSMLEEAFKTVQDERIIESIDDYRKNGADITNELHSILGTEVRELSGDLESYYSRYFNNRIKAVEFSEKYEHAFIQRKQQVAEADKKLSLLREQIENEQQQLASMKHNLDNQRQQLDDQLDAQNHEAYNAGVPSFNRSVANYNAKVKHIGLLIDRYNGLVSERNAIVIEEKELVKAIDSRPGTVESQ